MTKICTACHRDLPLDRFYHDTSKPDGLRTQCKHCFNAKTRVCLKCQQTKPRDQFTRLSNLCRACARSFKLCPSCQQIKPHEEFYKNPAQSDGFDSYCRPCKAAWLRNYNQTTGREKYRARLRSYNKSDQGKANVAAYRKSRKGRANARRYFHDYRREQAHEVAAHNAVTRAVKSGELAHISTQKCRDCGVQAQHYHHWSYERSHWLDVIPLCDACHSRIHHGD